MADNIQLSTNIGTGAEARTLSDANGNQWIPAVLCYATSTTPGKLRSFSAYLSSGCPETKNPSTSFSARTRLLRPHQGFRPPWAAPNCIAGTAVRRYAEIGRAVDYAA